MSKTLVTRFLLVGAYNTIVGYAIFLLLHMVFLENFHYLFILIISYVFSVSHAYFTQRILVFKSRNAIFNEYWRFFIVNLSGLMVNALILSLLIEFGLIVEISQAIAILLTTILSYLGHKNFSFRIRHSDL